jgi:hypothetical protein
MGFAAFRGHPVPEPDIGEPMAVGDGHAVLAARFTPLEGILASSRTTSPWPLPPCRSPSRGPDPLTSTVAGEHLGNPTCAERRLRGVAPPPSPDDDHDRCRSRRITSFPGLCSPSRSFRSSEPASRAVERGATRREKSEDERGDVQRAPFRPVHAPCVTARATSLRRAHGSDPSRRFRRIAGQSPGSSTSMFRRTHRTGASAARKRQVPRLRARQPSRGTDEIEKCPKRSESLARFTGERRNHAPPRS